MSEFVCEAEHFKDPERPRRAIDGLRLCFGCRYSLARNLAECKRLHEALGLALVGGTSYGERVDTSGDPNMNLNMTGVFWRENIRMTLVGWARTVAGERGITCPGRQVPELVKFLEPHLDWIAAHPDAADAVSELSSIAHEKEARRIAWPSRSERMFIGECPEPSLTVPEPCAARLYADPMEGEVECPACARKDTIEGWQRRMFGSATKTLAVGDEIAAHLSLRYKRPVDPATIRQWAHREKIERHGKDARGRVLYSLAEVREYVLSIWGKAAA